MRALARWLSEQSISRLFAYTRNLERELARERAERNAAAAKYEHDLTATWDIFWREKAHWEDERRQLLDRLLERHLISPVYDSGPRSTVTAERTPEPYKPPRQRLIADAMKREKELNGKAS